MIDFLTQMITDFETVIRAGIAAAASVYVAAVWWRTKALVPTLTSVVMAGVVVWATANVGVLRDQVDLDTRQWMQPGDTQ
ncbi:MAG: hypothetical protein ACR2HR_16980 [Euzebya sp.]